MGNEIFAVGMKVASLALVALAGFFLVYGIWENYLHQFFTEAKELKERSTLKALRRVLLRRLAGFNRGIMWQRYEKRINKRILSAGGLDDLQAEEFMGLQEISCIGFTFFGLVIINFMNKDLSMDLSWWWMVLFTAGGLFFPESWLRDQLKKRHNKITRELPYNLDLMTLSVEAGLDFQAAVATVVEKGKQGPLAEELGLMLSLLRMGKTREEALRTMADRVNLPQLSSFAAALIQADRMGTSMGKVLRIQSTQLRIQRTQRAEKQANEAPVKMLLPLIACIFPTVFLVLFGPIFYQLIVGIH